MEVFNMNEMEISGMVNQGTSVLLEALYNEGKITEEQYKDFINYQIITVKRNIFSRFWDKLFNKLPESHIKLIAVKIVWRREENE